MTLVLSRDQIPSIETFNGIHTIAFMDDFTGSWEIREWILEGAITPTRIVFGSHFGFIHYGLFWEFSTVEFIDFPIFIPCLIEQCLRRRPNNPRSLFFVQTHDKFKNETLWNFQTPVRIKLNMFILASAQKWERGGSKSALKRLPQELIRMTARFLL